MSVTCYEVRRFEIVHRETAPMRFDTSRRRLAKLTSAEMVGSSCPYRILQPFDEKCCKVCCPMLVRYDESRYCQCADCGPMRWSGIWSAYH